ncbi:hypothetical protein D3C87_175360 [compost metagenome]
MTNIRSMGIIAFVALVVTLASVQDAFAQRRFSRGPSLSGDMSLGLGISTVGASQDDLNKVIDESNGTNSANTKNLGSAWEFYAQWAYRFQGSSYAFVLRPSYFMQEQTGSGTGGSYDYKLNGFTVFPIFRVYALENNFIKFFMQVGAGYGSLSGDITMASQNLKFKGSAFGAVGGIGADFCFTEAHCLTVEGNLRYLPIERNVTTGGNCTSMSGISQCGGSKEVEHDGADLKTTMSGVQGLIGYTMNF